MFNIPATILFCCLAIPVLAQPIDQKATRETRALYYSLERTLQKGILFGHQDDLAYGVNEDGSNWWNEPGRSDIKAVTGDYPAVYGWELGGLETSAENNLDGVPFSKMQEYIRQGYERGGVITISWHLRNPVTGGSAWDSTGDVVKDIVPGGAYHDRYKAYLDKVAAFLNTLKGKNGEYIPVIFRIFHELNGDWFWWGKKHCTPGELQQLWRFTVSYLRDVKGLHHLLYAYNTDRFASREVYLERYPGNHWVDIVGFDIYQAYAIAKNEDFRQELHETLGRLVSIAADSNKIPALTEFGYNKIPDPHWWTKVFLEAIRSCKIAYALAWRNAGGKPGGEAEYYVPFKGQVSADDFKRFSRSGKILFQKAAAKEKLYQE